MKRHLLSLLAFLLLLPGWIRAQDDAARHLERFEKKYASLKDYTAEVKVHFDIETFKAPDLQAKLYFKAPDKMKVESKRVFFFPKEGGYFNPSLFKREEFEVRFLESLTHEGRKAVRLRLIPKKPKKETLDLVVTIDTEQDLIREVHLLQAGGREIDAAIQYGTFGSFDLPTEIKLRLDLPVVEPSFMRGFAQSGEKPTRVTGKIELTYSNYKVNSGLKDDLFKETEPPKTR